jgi:hypothetical protein
MSVHAPCDGYAQLFGLPAPAVPEASAHRPDPSSWLAYQIEAAKAAGHAVSDKVKDPERRERLAWTGARAGAADKLDIDAKKITADGDLGKLVASVSQRLRNEHAAAQEPPKAPTKKKR